jgi:Ran GTPase-activating protein (RanGAP) involved in mRNA processing and transport
MKIFHLSLMLSLAATSLTAMDKKEYPLKKSNKTFSYIPSEIFHIIMDFAGGKTKGLKDVNQFIRKKYFEANKIKNNNIIKIKFGAKTKLNDNKISKKDYVATEFLKSKYSNTLMTVHIIMDNGLKFTDFMMQLNRTLKSSKNTFVLNLSCKTIGPDGAIALFEVLKTNKTIIHINLGYNSILDKGIIALAEMLKTNQTITHVDIRGNPEYFSSPRKYVEYLGIKHLAEMLKTNTSLTSINLSYNNIGPDDAKHLAEMLETNTSLTHLDISNNRIGEYGTKYLIEALKINRSLTHINLGDNRDNQATYITPMCNKSLSDVLKINKIIISLSLSWNNITNEGAIRLCEALKTKTSLTHLDISNNRIGPDLKKELREIAKDKNIELRI